MADNELLFTVIETMQKHIAILNDETGELMVDVAVLKNQMRELMWWTKSIFGAVLALVVNKAFEIFTKVRNNKKK